MKILVVFGTRPEAIKMAPLVKALHQNPQFDVKVCQTGQHREMLTQVMSVFGLEADIDLDVMEPGQPLSRLTGKILVALEQVLQDFRPDRILVHGDTTTAFAASLCAYYNQIAVAHVEAGLRTHQRYSPWPEELNRKLIGSLADLHFAPTPLARENLLREGVADDRIFVTGNTVVDALFAALEIVANRPEIAAQLTSLYPFLNQEFVLVTGHRRENYGDGFDNICAALKEIAQTAKVPIVYPVHLNPSVKKPVEALLSDTPNVHLIPPVDYLQFVWMMQQCKLILTDSGGIQEEAPSLNKPVLVMRDTTERQEAVDAGTVKLVGTQPDIIVSNALKLLRDKDHYKAMANKVSPFGDGTTSAQIVGHLINEKTDNTHA